MSGLWKEELYPQPPRIARPRDGEFKLGGVGGLAAPLRPQLRRRGRYGILRHPNGSSKAPYLGPRRTFAADGRWALRRRASTARSTAPSCVRSVRPRGVATLYLGDHAAEQPLAAVGAWRNREAPRLKPHVSPLRIQGRMKSQRRSVTVALQSLRGLASGLQAHVRWCCREHVHDKTSSRLGPQNGR